MGILYPAKRQLLSDHGFDRAFGIEKVKSSLLRFPMNLALDVPPVGKCQTTLFRCRRRDEHPAKLKKCNAFRPSTNVPFDDIEQTAYQARAQGYMIFI